MGSWALASHGEAPATRCTGPSPRRRSKDERIEQLHGEKERLDYERQLASHARASKPSPSSASSNDLTSTQTPQHHVRRVVGAAASCPSHSSDSEAWPICLPAQIQASGLDGRTCCPLQERSEPTPV